MYGNKKKEALLSDCTVYFHRCISTDWYNEYFFFFSLKEAMNFAVEFSVSAVKLW
jgi:hypothetical protein